MYVLEGTLPVYFYVWIVNRCSSDMNGSIFGQVADVLVDNGTHSTL